MRDLLDALKTLEKYGLLPEKGRRGKGLSRDDVEQALNKGTRYKVRDDEIKRAKAWYKDGYSIVEIAADLQRAQSTVRRMLGLQ